MKFFLAIALIATVASAASILPAVVNGEMAHIQEIIDAINNPSTNPATAAALEEMLLEALGLNPEPVIVGPAIVEADSEPISVGPVIVDFPLPEDSIVAEEIVDITPVVVTPIVEESAPASAPLVQIILNINQAAAGSSPVAVGPAVVAQPDPVNVVETAVNPVQVVESAPVAPVQVVEAAPVAPVQVVESAPVSPVQVVDVSPIQVVETAPIAVEPVIVGTPVIPSPAVVLPEQLN